MKQVAERQSEPLEKLQEAMDSLLKSPYSTEGQFRGILGLCEKVGGSFERVISQFNEGLVLVGGEKFETTDQLYEGLSVEEKNHLKSSYIKHLERIKGNFPSFEQDFPAVFSILSGASDGEGKI